MLVVLRGLSDAIRTDLDAYMVVTECQSCAGARLKAESLAVTIANVPTGATLSAGVDNGDRIRLAGEGEPGQAGGPPGDLYVNVVVKPHPIFTRDDTDLHCEVPIDFVQAALGGARSGNCSHR